MMNISRKTEYRPMIRDDMDSGNALRSVAALIYETDPYIYPALFGSKRNGIDVIPDMIVAGDTMFNINNIYESLELNFHNLNFITSYSELIDDYQLILGNPPYVEKSKVDYANSVKYGNLYADVIHNSIDLLSDNGVMGYIIPISYVSTSRMASVRRYVEQNTSAQYVLSYADRPDCLFVGVHQKLNILLAQKTLEKDNHKIYTSDYNYWYKSQRTNLFNTTEVLDNSFVNENYYPKLANNIEESIFTKVNSDTDTIISKQVSSCEKPLYLNKRAAFWIKSFIEAPYKSNEYAIINYKKEDGSLDSVEVSSITSADKLELDNTYHAPAAFISGAGIPYIVSLKKNCIVDPDQPMNKDTYTQCIAGLYDYSGAKTPNRFTEDLLAFGGAGLKTGADCEMTIGNVCIAKYLGKPSSQEAAEAKQIALAIELFTDGSLNTFAKNTNVDTNSRIICYDILDLGKQLLPIGMLVVLDSILNRITANRAKGRNTYIFIDEIYLLFQHEYSANFLFTLWKRVRKYGAYCTGITQNVDDLLQSHTARTMLANSEFIVMLNQAATDRTELAKLLSISDTQMSYITNVGAGQGLLKVGSSLVPFINKFPTDTKLYKLMTTKPGEDK